MQLFIVTLMLATATAAVVSSESSQESRERARGLRGLRGVSGARGARGVSGARGERIVRDDFDTPTAEGDYKWAIQTEGGIYHEQRGSKSAAGAAGAEGAAGAVGAAGAAGAAGAVVQGQYQYTAPDGQVFNVVYIADSLGFRATAPHLPTPPPPPPPPPAIARALAYTARLREQGKINL